MYCWEDTNSFSNFSYTLTDTRYVLMERHKQHQKLLQHNNTLVMYCWKDTKSVSNFSNTITDTSYVLLERHEQLQHILQHNN
jgi:hypothetical protein